MTDKVETGEAGETPPKPRKPRMVNVYYAHKFRSIHLGGGKKIPPGCTGKIPTGVYEKLKDYNWIKRAERGDVV